MDQQDPFDGMLSADREAPIGPRAGSALDALARDMQAAPSTVPDADQPMHITAQAVREENASAATIGADVASKFGAVVRETNVRRKQLSPTEVLDREIGALHMLVYIKSRFEDSRLIGLTETQVSQIIADARGNYEGIACGEVTL